MTRFADLHIHTSFSDSTASPEQIITRARDQGVDCLAITDHDTVEGVGPVMALGQAAGIEVLPGVELSTEANNREIHILGYCFDLGHPEFLASLATFRQTRTARLASMVEKLHALGMTDISAADIPEADAVGRLHLAVLMVKRGYAEDVPRAFQKYLGEGRPGYVKKHKLSPEDAILLIQQAGGVAVLAHPMMTQVDEMIPRLVKAGLDGLEVYYPYAGDKAVLFYERLAKKHQLLLTGGSDAHGENKTHTDIGTIKIPYELVEALKARAGKR